MTKSILESLTFPVSANDFLRTGIPKEPLVVHDLGETIETIRKLPYLKSRTALLRRWTGLVQAHLPDVADESSSIDASPADAEKLFRNGMGLLFNHVEKISPTLRRWVRQLRQELGLPTSTHARCLVYATPDGKGTSPHFDQNVNFVLQLHGTKKWWLAPNATVANPTERHTIGQPVDPELAGYLEDEFPTEMPKGRVEIVLESGSMLFVPRGYWHGTEARGEALALNFTFGQPTWIDLLTLALRSRLSLSPEWRELADGVSSSDPKRRARAESRFDLLLRELVDDLPHWRAADILGATEGDF